MYEKKSYLRFYGAGHAVLTRCINLLNISLACVLSATDFIAYYQPVIIELNKCDVYQFIEHIKGKPYFGNKKLDESEKKLETESMV